ncbi:MAG: hypothetical protein ACYTEQ_11380 [Planctomycetota bacterium]|jgi:hypothetical protein
MNSQQNNSPPPEACADKNISTPQAQATAAITPSVGDESSGPREPNEDVESKHGLRQLGALLDAEFSHLDEKTIRMLGLFVALQGSTGYSNHKLADRLYHVFQGIEAGPLNDSEDARQNWLKGVYDGIEALNKAT